MTPRNPRSAAAWSALLALAAVNAAGNARAQEADIPTGRARSVNERLTNETGRIPSATDDAARIEAQRNPANSRSLGGLGVGMLAEHAVGMAIEGASLKAIAGPASAGANAFDPSERLRMKGKKMMVESQTLIGLAGEDSRALSDNPVAARFQTAAKTYIMILANLEPGNPTEIAQVTMINQSVKDVLDADHIRRMTPIASGSAALEQLKDHAALMRTQGMDLLVSFKRETLTNDGPSANVTTLAERGRELVEAASVMGRQVGIPGPAASIPGQAPNPRPETIGGTYGTGSSTAGTYQGLGHPPGSTLPKTQSEPSPVPNNSGGTTGSTGGLPPR